MQILVGHGRGCHHISMWELCSCLVGAWDQKVAVVEVVGKASLVAETD